MCIVLFCLLLDWGQIEGIHADYIILQYINISKANIDHAYYYSTDNGINFTRITYKLDDFIESQASCIHTETSLFTGQPMYTYPDAMKKVTDDESGEEDDDDEDNAKVKPRKLNEVERLLYVIIDIDSNTHITIKGEYNMSVNGNINKTSQPVSIPIQQLCDKSQYQLLRNPVLDITHSKIRGSSLHTHCEFLDSLHEIAQQPDKNGIWTVQQSADKLNVTLRNLQYPGYEYTAELNSDNHVVGVGCYVGNGIKLNEIQFLL